VWVAGLAGLAGTLLRIRALARRGEWQSNV
jgi:hypothetical protein